MSVIRERGTFKRTNNGVEATSVYTIVAQDEVNAEVLLLAATAVQRGTIYATHQGTVPDLYCVCQDIQISTRTPAPVGGTGLYQADCVFNHAPPDQAPGPTDAAKFHVERAFTTVPVDHDAAGNPIVNTVLEPIDPPLTKHDISKVLVGRWYDTAPNWLTIYNELSPFEGKLNLTPFQGAPKGSLLCESLEPEDAGGGLFFVTGRWLYRPPKTLFGVTYEGFAETALNTGRRTKGSLLAGGIREYPPIIVNGVPVSDPVLLNAAGQRLPDGANPHVLSFDLYEYAEFNDIDMTP